MGDFNWSSIILPLITGMIALAGSWIGLYWSNINANDRLKKELAYKEKELHAKALEERHRLTYEQRKNAYIQCIQAANECLKTLNKDAEIRVKPLETFYDSCCVLEVISTREIVNIADNVLQAIRFLYEDSDAMRSQNNELFTKAVSGIRELAAACNAELKILSTQ